MITSFGGLVTTLACLASDVGGRPEIATNGLGMQLVRLPAGEFVMGSPLTEKGRRADEPQRNVRLTRDFWIGRHEVTRGQFRRFVEATNYVTDAEGKQGGGYGYDAATNTLSGRDRKYSWRFTGFEQTDDHPVVNVSWNDAVAFCEWLTKQETVGVPPLGGNGPAKAGTPTKYRLPTEAEWEYACRAGSTTAFANGDDPERVVEMGNIVDATADRLFPDRFEVKRSDGFVFTAPVGTFRPNAWGLFDMHGNVWEWTVDNFGPPPTMPQVDPRGLEKARDKVIKGGDWYHDWSFARSAQRFPISPWLCRRHAGFRVVREIESR